MIKLVVFDQDGVLVTPKSTWWLVKEENGLLTVDKNGVKRDLFNVKELLRLSPEEENAMELSFLIGLPRQTFEKVGDTVPLDPDAKEVVEELFSMGINVHIATLSLDVIANRVAARISRRFEENGFKNVHSAIALFNTDNKFVGILAYPNKFFNTTKKILNSNEIDKVKVINSIRRSLGLKKEEVLFVGDGYDVEVAKSFPTLAYNSRDPEFCKHSIKTISSLKEVVEYVKQINSSTRFEKQKLL